MTPWWFRLAGSFRDRALRRQKLVQIDIDGLEHLSGALASKQGILLVPNHSFHWDSYCLLECAARLNTPFYFMTAWQVFAMSGWFERYSMRRCGCFSVDREGRDVESLKTAIDILERRPHPLVIFPEGDIYHTNDRVTPFRDGAAAIALMAARKADRTVVVIPTAVKAWYIDNPGPSMVQTLAHLERRLYWQPRSDQPLLDRILHVADGLLALKELEYFQSPQTGSLPERIQRLAHTVLSSMESRYDIRNGEAVPPERVRELRRCIIARQQNATDGGNASERERWSQDMERLFLVIQLYSYPGDYMVQNPTWERMAETLDKLEEDVLGAPYPSIRGRRRVQICLDAPIELPRGKDKRMSAGELTGRIESRVQSMLDRMNADSRG